MYGNAWINAAPGTSRFARWAIREGHAKKSRDGGVDLLIPKRGSGLLGHEEKIASVFIEVLRLSAQLADVNLFMHTRID
ncbi:MAG TPA: hypothetical protein VK425_07445 [Acidimicrobiales bacterium]|nr:hypothetical protein [Acidimicrobiales bacterium]